MREATLITESKGGSLRRYLHIPLLIYILVVPRQMVAGAAGAPFLHPFEIWGTLTTTDEKLELLIGITNGLFTGGSTQSMHLLKCLDANVSYEQAIAMIDKYYKENPELWHEPVSYEVISALTVAKGPCEGLNPMRRKN